MNNIFEEYEYFRKKIGYKKDFLNYFNETKDFLKECKQNNEEHIVNQLIKEFKEKVINNNISDIEKENIIMGIQSGVGGEEAKLFVQKLTDFYIRLSKEFKWNVEIIDDTNYSNVQLKIKGKNVYKFLRLESGVHRIQRVPPTEKKGRLHTSAAAIFVIPDIYNSEFHINQSDLKIECFRSGGKGGQHVNKTESAVRITHIPTGITASCQNERNQIANKELAMENLKKKLEYLENSKMISDRYNSISAQTKDMNRSDKIRTYNFKQDRLTDHRTNISISNLDSYFKAEDVAINFIKENLSVYESMLFLEITNNL